MSTILAFASWMSGGCVSAELLGYLLHRLLHSGRIAFLSRSHMRHHLLHYGPSQKQRSQEYLDVSSQRISLGNVGIEWLLPAAVLIALLSLLLYFFRVRPIYAVVYLGATLAWSFLMFSYLHDVMHLQKVWIEKHRVLGKWFAQARRRHAIHHCSLSDDGLMNKNFGISFFFFDRLFGTLDDRGAALNQNGLQAAMKKFSGMLGEDCASPSRDITRMSAISPANTTLTAVARWPLADRGNPPNSVVLVP